MEWTKEDSQYLRDFRKNLDSDNILLKEEVKQLLLNDKYILHVLHNKELEEVDAEADEYFGQNILDHYLIAPTQTHIDNFVCYETQMKELYKYNETQKTQQLIFYILCSQKDIRDKDTSLARHDLLSALLTNLINYRVFKCGRMVLESDLATIVDDDYMCRTLIFTSTTDANLVKTKNGMPHIVNKVGMC